MSVGRSEGKVGRRPGRSPEQSARVSRLAPATVAALRSQRQPSRSLPGRTERDVRDPPPVRLDACSVGPPAHIVDDTAGVDVGSTRGGPDRVEDGSSFCESCGLDSDRLGSAGASDFRVCPDCSSSTCANCWNQVAGRCLACSPFHLASAPARPTRRIVPASLNPAPVAAAPPRQAANPARSPLGSGVGRAVAADGGIVSGAGRVGRRGLGKAARFSLVAVVALAAVASVRAVTLTGAVTAQDEVGVETLAPEPLATSDPATGVPKASAPTALQDPSEPPAERHHGSGTAASSTAGGSSGTGGGGGGGGGGPTPGATPSPGPSGTPGPRGTPIPTPSKPPATPAPTPEPGTPTPDPGTPTPDPGTPTPDPGTPTPGPGTPTPDPATPTPDP